MHHVIVSAKKRPPSKGIRFLDRIMEVFAFIPPLVVIPQIIQVILAKSAENISLIMWVVWFIVSVPWLIYGIVHRIKPLIFMYSLWLIVHGTMIFLIIIY